MSSTLIWKDEKLVPEWIFLRNRRPKLVKIGHFRSISKNCRNLKIFGPISLQNPTQRIFHLHKKVVSPLLFPLRTFFPLKITVFTLLVKIVENWKFFGLLPIEIQCKEFFIYIKKLSARSFLRSWRFSLWKVPVFTLLIKIVEN